jgi:hypothetical protein
LKLSAVSVPTGVTTAPLEPNTERRFATVTPPTATATTTRTGNQTRLSIAKTAVKVSLSRGPSPHARRRQLI